MAEDRKKQRAAKQELKEIGEQLVDCEICPDESIIVKLLENAASAFKVLKQSDSAKDAATLSGDSQTRQGLLDQRCRDAGVLTPYSVFCRTVSSMIFRSLLRMFEELHDTSSKYFRVRAKILETVDKRQFLAMLDTTGCQDLVLKMLKSFFRVVREDHPQSLINSISSIITSILAKNVDADPDPNERNSFQQLLDVILRNIIKKKKGGASASYRLAASVIQNYSEWLKCCICQFLTSCILNRDAVGSLVKESYHDIILEIYQVAPELLLSVIPHLTRELLTDQVDVRIKAIYLIKRLLPLQGKHFAQNYPFVLKEFLNRFSDKSAEVRLTALSSAKVLYIANLSGRDSLETLFTAIGGRLLDHDDKVRMEAVNMVCELAKTNLNCISSDLITQAADRLRDKKVLVRTKALEKMVELYQEYCLRLAADTTSFNEKIEEIPCKILMLCYEKDCQEFRPQSVELVLVDLFPVSLSTEEKTKHWISIFSHFKPPHLRALKTILSQKRRLRDGLKHYLDLCRRTEEGPGETEREIEALVVRMSACFLYPTKAKECFQKLKELRDNGVFSVLEKFLKENSVDSDTIKDVYLKELGEQKTLSEFFHLLFRKCAFNVFGFEDVRYILYCLSSEDAEEKHFKIYQTQLLLTIISAFPSLLKGSETKFLHLILKREIPFNEQVIEIFAREGSQMHVKLGDIYPSLEKVCLEGTRSQSKLAVSAISALSNAKTSDDQFFYPQLCKVLVDSLLNGQNAPTVLQSLGCLAQYSVSTFESHEKVITNHILEKIFQQNDTLASKDLDTSTCCSACDLKVYALKTIVRSFLPHKNACLGRPFSILVEIIKQMLQNHQLSTGCIQCGRDETCIRLAAAKSVLRLSRKWDLHITPEIFRLTILVAKDPSPVTRRSFTSKLHKLLLNHVVPIRYACAFSFVALDPLEDLRINAMKYLEEFIREYGKRVQIHETMTKEGAATHPACLVVFLTHVLAHDNNFPDPDCRDVNLYAEFMSPLFVSVQSLVNGNSVDYNLHLKSYTSLYLRSIFKALKKADDAADAQMTPKLCLLAEVGLSILESLNTKITPLEHTPALVLLPSSLYKSGPSEMREADPYPSLKADASFIKNLVSSLKTEVFLIGSTGTKHRLQFPENSLLPTGIRHNKPSPASGYTEKLLIDKTKEQVVELQTGKKEFSTSSCEADTSEQKNLAMPSLLGTVVVDNKLSAAEDGHKTDARRESEATSSDHCDSKSKSSLPCVKVVSCPRNKDSTIETSSIPSGPSVSSTASDQVDQFTPKRKQNIESNGGGLASKHIKTCSPTEECGYSVIEDSFDSTKSHHQDLDDPLAQNCDQSSCSTVNAESMYLDSLAYDSKEENVLNKRNLRIRKVSQAAKRTKRCHDTIGTESSQVVDLSGNQMYGLEPNTKSCNRASSSHRSTHQNLRRSQRQKKI